MIHLKTYKASEVSETLFRNVFMSLAGYASSEQIASEVSETATLLVGAKKIDR